MELNHGDLSIRCRDSAEERHGVDHHCTGCKPWLILQRLEQERDDPKCTKKDEKQIQENIASFYANHAMKTKKTWICSLCYNTVPIHKSTCPCFLSHTRSQGRNRFTVCSFHH